MDLNIKCEQRGLPRETRDKYILTGHKLREMTERFAEYHIPVIRIALLELLLQVTTAMLVLAQASDFAL